MDWLRLGLGAFGAAAMGLLSRRLGWLNAAAAWTAAVVGFACFGFGGWPVALPLLTFFTTSTLLGRLPVAGDHRKHGTRNAHQVLANGGMAALASVLAALGAGEAALAAASGALAAANADTWATEIGTRLGGTPRQLALGRAVPRGASGGMTAVGLVGGAAGALVVALVGASTGLAHWSAVFCGGVVGMVADSVVGGTLQALYRCPSCGKSTEDRVHDCVTPLVLVRGLPWLDNDGVNLTATVVGALVTAAILAR